MGPGSPTGPHALVAAPGMAGRAAAALRHALLRLPWSPFGPGRGAGLRDGGGARLPGPPDPLRWRGKGRGIAAALGCPRAHAAPGRVRAPEASEAENLGSGPI